MFGTIKHDATVIEITPEVVAFFTSNGARLLEVENANLNDNVVILQFPSGNFSISDGEIENIKEIKCFTKLGLNREAEALLYSSLYTVYYLDCVALARHSAGTTGFGSSQPAAIRKATALSAVIKAYLSERPDFEQEVPNVKIETVSLNRSQLGEIGIIL